MMEKPAEREAKFEDRMNRLQSNCERIKTEWDAPNHMDGHWKEVNRRAVCNTL